jgi:hypothetical protein
MQTFSPAKKSRLVARLSVVDSGDELHQRFFAVGNLQLPV